MGSLAVVCSTAKEVAMSHDHCVLVSQLRETLTEQRFSAVVVHNYCVNADIFLSYLERRNIAIEAVTTKTVAQYLELAVRRFRTRHGRAPAPRWKSIPRAGVHGLLKVALKRWPPEPVSSDPVELFCREVCNEYQKWLREERGLAVASIDALMWEARHFCAWFVGRADAASFMNLGIRDVDAYFAMRAPGLRRRSLKDVAERLRSFVRHLHRSMRTSADLSAQFSGPTLYAYETIPSVLSPDEITTVLKFAQEDQSPKGLRDYAVLQLLSVYGLRVGEIRCLCLNDIDWRAEILRIHHSKTGAYSLLPLMQPAGEALISYLKDGRPKASVREVFVRTRAPFVPLSRTGIYNGVRRRMEAAGVKPNGKRGPHIFRHARAVSLLRASIPRKVIGDVLGHRSMESTIPYLKLATEDLRDIALEIPGCEVCS
jgi:integrase/recombinase XerD